LNHRPRAYESPALPLSYSAADGRLSCAQFRRVTGALLGPEPHWSAHRVSHRGVPNPQLGTENAAAKAPTRCMNRTAGAAISANRAGPRASVARAPRTGRSRPRPQLRHGERPARRLPRGRATHCRGGLTDLRRAYLEPTRSTSRSEARRPPLTPWCRSPQALGQGCKKRARNRLRPWHPSASTAGARIPASVVRPEEVRRLPGDASPTTPPRPWRSCRRQRQRQARARLPDPAPLRESESTLTAASSTSPVMISCHWIGKPSRYRPL
jgi:hypothetical protein